MVRFETRSPLGLPLTAEDHVWAVDELVATGGMVVQPRDLDHALQVVERDRALLLAGNRWHPEQPDPAELVPGDVAAIRYLAARDLPMISAVYARLSHTDPEPFVRDASYLFAYEYARTLIDLATATPYYVPVNAADAVLRSRPPPPELADELRLPSPQVLVLFGADLYLEPQDHPTTKPRGAAAELIGTIAAHGGYVTGLVLRGDEQGRLRDDFLWLLAANSDPTQPPYRPAGRARTVKRGWRSQATLAPLVDAVAAAVSWGDWKTPRVRLDLPAAPDTKQWRKAIRRGAFRRHEPDGAVLGVKVIDLQAAAERATTTAATTLSNRASPRPHPRIGYYRRVRVGPRADWHYEIRWIPPVAVLGYDPNRADPQSLVVHRLPPPPIEQAAHPTDREHPPHPDDQHPGPRRPIAKAGQYLPSPHGPAIPEVDQAATEVATAGPPEGHELELEQ